MAAATLRIPIARLGGQRRPRQEHARRRPAWPRARRSASRRRAGRCGTRASAPARPSATSPERTALAARRRFEVPADARCRAPLRGVPGGRAGSTRPWTRRCPSSSAAPSCCTSRARRVSTRRWPDASACRPTSRPRYRPYPFLRDEMYDAYAAADLSWAAPGPRRSPRRPPSGSRSSSCPYPHAAGHQAANARLVEEAGAGLGHPGRGVRRSALLLDATAILGEPRRHVEMAAASRGLGRPGAADAVAELVLALAERRPLPEPEKIERLSREGGRAGWTAARIGRGTDRVTRRLRPTRRPPAGHGDRSAGSACGSSATEPLAPLTTMRVGGPADLFAEVRNLFELRGIVRFARARELPIFLLGRGSDLVISDAGMGGLVVQVRAEGHRVEGERIRCEAGAADGPAATVAKDAGLSGLEFGLAIPGTVGGAVWANAGAHGADVRSILVEASVIPGDGGPERVLRRGRAWAWPTGRAGAQARARMPRHVPGRRDRGHVRPRARGAGRDRSAARRDPPLAAGPPAGRDALRGERLPQPADGPARARSSRPRRSRGRASAARRSARSTPTSSSTTGARPRRTCAAWPSSSGDRVAEEAGIELRYEVVFAGDWSGWVEGAVA